MVVRMKFRNPCKKCLVQACCTELCSDKESFNFFTNNLIPLFFVILSIMTVMGFISFFFFIFLFNKITISIVSLTWFSLSILCIAKLDDNVTYIPSSFSEAIILLIFGPVILTFFSYMYLISERKNKARVSQR